MTRAKSGQGESIAMGRYSVFAVAREAMRNHQGWTRAWASPEPKRKYDVIIIGAGGHGLATAYYLAKEFGLMRPISNLISNDCPLMYCIRVPKNDFYMLPI